MGIVETCHTHKFYRHMFFWFLYFTFLKLPPPPRAAICYIPYIKTLYPLQNDTHHHISSNISSFCKKILSKNCLPKLTRVPRVSPPFFRCWGYINPQTLRRFSHEGQGAFGSVYEARDVKSMQMVVCKVQWKIQKNNQQMTNQWQWTEPTTPKKNGTQPSFFWWFGLVEGYEPKNVEEKRLLSGLVGTKKLSEREIPCPSWRCR